LTNDTRYWLALHHSEGISPSKLYPLVARFGSAERAWNAPLHALREAGINEASVAKFQAYRDKTNPDTLLNTLHQHGAHLLTITDAEYPPLLRKIVNAPPLLYIKGRLQESDQLALAVVGTRNASQYGRDASFQLSQSLAQHGVTIISGLAQGVDLNAHRGALQAKGRTIAILGCGIDRIYPTEHTAFAKEIVQNGALISEFRLGTPPHRNNFPQRNRIISGMALGVLVIEAPEGSGALITANTALEQGRDVYAVPSGIFSPKGAGTNKLIQDGAKPIMKVEDILNELNIAMVQAETRQRTEEIIPDNSLESQVINLLSDTPIHLDELARHLNLSTKDLSPVMAVMELKGLAQMVGTMHYCRSHG